MRETFAHNDGKAGSRVSVRILHKSGQISIQATGRTIEFSDKLGGPYSLIDLYDDGSIDIGDFIRFWTLVEQSHLPASGHGNVKSWKGIKIASFLNVEETLSMTGKTINKVSIEIEDGVGKLHETGQKGVVEFHDKVGGTHALLELYRQKRISRLQLMQLIVEILNSNLADYCQAKSKQSIKA